MGTSINKQKILARSLFNINDGVGAPAPSKKDPDELDAVFWFDMTDTSELIGHIEDRSINGVNCKIQTTYKLIGGNAESAIPYVESGQNSLGYTNFNGDGFPWLQMSEGTELGSEAASINLGSNYSIFVVVDNEAESGVSGITGGRNPNAYVLRFSGNALIQSVFDSGGNVADSIATSSEFGSVIATTSYDAETGGLVELRWNGTDTNSPGEFEGSPVNEAKILVGKSNNSAQYFTGRIYEFAIFNRVLVDEDKDLLDAYVEDKYNVEFEG